MPQKSKSGTTTVEESVESATKSPMPRTTPRGREKIGRAADGGPINRAAGWLARHAYFAQHRSVAATTLPARVLWQTAMTPNGERPGPEVVAEVARRFEKLLARDVENVDAGFYPREVLFGFPLGRYLRKWPVALAEFPRIWWRSRREAHDELPAEVRRDAYPSYYLRTFHWQTDGWFSDRSADLYDAEVEFLFGGTADIMRRMSIPPLVESLRGRSRPRILDVGCGTGRFLKQLAAAFPDARLYGVDLSPYYLRRAHAVVGEDAAELSLLAENAESLPFPDGYFDAVSCVFLFHELPKRARRKVMNEMARVVRPGGTVVVCDSTQMADSAGLGVVLESFPQTYHEPYYKSYLRDDLTGIARESGLTVEGAETHFVSRVVAARRPRSQTKSQSPRMVSVK